MSTILQNDRQPVGEVGACRCGWGMSVTCGRAGHPNCEYASKAMKIPFQNRIFWITLAVLGAFIAVA